MSKSLDNYIGINEKPDHMYEQVMQIKDHMIIRYFNLVTDLEPRTIDDFRCQIESGRTNPKNIKMRLAREIVTLYHSKEDATSAEARFTRVFSKGLVPKEIPTFSWENSDDLMTFLVRNNVVVSKSEVRRLITQKGIKINDEIIEDLHIIKPNSQSIIKIGKKRFVKVL